MNVRDMAIYTDYVAAALMFNLQILPESLITGLLILAVVLANQAILAMVVGALITQFVTDSAARVIMKLMPGSATRTSTMDMCNTGFVAKSWMHLLRGSDIAESLWHPNAPSVFMATIGYFVGYGWALQQLYKEEIRAGIMSQSSLFATAVVSGLLLLTALAFRVSSGCESLIGAVGGVAFGLAIGYLGCVALGYTTDRRATNIWGIPLLRDRINNGSALYICPKEE